MRSSLQKAQEEESREGDEGVRKATINVVKTTHLAKQALNYGGITSELWAEVLNVTARTVQRWRCGEVEIPENRATEIIWAARDLIWKQREAIEREIEFWIKEKYGPRSY